ncbi:Tetratricopeptide-like helical domain-containing protein [Dioscorea alata]|uniref:Tetratricopeptide-like helical domain-containing protein n=2 Tax=Dioscorea alata TaxID=55571 RepID=A0ACB7UJE7_DIOAL|nr:Tetratricopeptide-like helical domain-containing protein [Dioscorea alata]
MLFRSLRSFSASSLPFRRCKAVNEELRNLCFTGRLPQAVELLCHDLRSCVDPRTYALLLQESIHWKESKLGRRIHAQMVIAGFSPDEYLRTKLVIFYAKVGDLWTARQLFDRIPDRNLIQWNAMISGYVLKGLEQEGLNVYYSMRSVGLAPDQFTFASVFRACARLALLEHGKRAHAVMIKNHLKKDNVIVSSALVDMYLKCSSLDDGHRAFDVSLQRNVVTWTSLISGYGKHGQVAEVLELFYQMITEGFRPNSVTFLALLSACSHGGLIDAGWSYFNSMEAVYDIRPTGEHYAAIVDMLGRAGRLHEAYEFVKMSPCAEHSVIWGALLGACRIHGDMELIRLAANKFLEMQPKNVGKYIVLSNTFANNGMWDDVADVRRKITKLQMKKEPAWSSIELQGVVHTFLVRDNTHEEIGKIYETIRSIGCALAEAGYVSSMKID